MVEAEDLNYDFNFNMFLGKITMGGMKSAGDKKLALKWMQKLSDLEGTIEELQLRNDFMYFLVCNIQNGQLQLPFSEMPPNGPLPALAHLLPGGGNLLEEAGAWNEKDSKSEKPMLYQSSPDGGAFLAAQPRPRCGAFCYLAVVSRSNKNEM